MGQKSFSEPVLPILNDGKPVCSHCLGPLQCVANINSIVGLVCPNCNVIWPLMLPNTAVAGPN